MKNSFLNELALSKPDYKDIFINPDSISIKRLLDQDVLKSASIIQSQSEPKSKIIDREKIASGSKPKTTIKTSSKPTPRPAFSEAEIDIDTLPVIQGSFEVTKTEADITRNTKETPRSTSTLKPFMISPASIKITDNRNQTFGRPEVVTAKIEKTDKNGQATTVSTTTTLKITTSTPTPKSEIGSTDKMIKTTVMENSTVKQPNFTRENDPLGLLASKKDLPALDVNLFTTAPVLDHEPWLPINPNTPNVDEVEVEVTQATPTNITTPSEPSTTTTTQNILPSFKEELLRYKTKIDTQSYVDGNGNLYYYNSFKNPSSQVEIENLGAIDVRPYPLPVNKINEEPEPATVAPPVLMNITVDDKFEHLGGGVIVKKEEPDDEEKSTESNYMENKLESRAGDSDIKAVSAEKIAQEVKNLLLSSTTATISSVSSTKPTTDSTSVWENAPQLFPIGSKWEFVNATRVTPFENIGLRKVYNQTLQALVVENSQPSVPDIEDVKLDKPKVDNLQNLSSIFDTIASKLGIKPDVSSKIPPFQEKMTTQPLIVTTVPTTQRATTTQKATTTIRITSPPTTTRRTTKKVPPTTVPTTQEPLSTTTQQTTSTTTRMIPVQLYHAGDKLAATPISQESTSSETFLGQAEVEIVDPNVYDDMLRQSQMTSAATPAVTKSTPAPPLVTLLPVKSNSGIRNFNREKLKHTAGIVTSAGGETVSKKSFNSRGPIFAENIAESVVKTSMIVEV